MDIESIKGNSISCLIANGLHVQYLEGVIIRVKRRFRAILNVIQSI